MTQGAFAAILKGDQILLVKPPDWVSQYSGSWNFPGGVVQEGESLENGAKREISEETGVVCSVEGLLDTAYNEKFDTSITIFKANYISGELTIQEKEISEAAWFPIKDAVSLPLAFNIKKTIEKLIMLLEVA